MSFGLKKLVRAISPLIRTNSSQPSKPTFDDGDDNISTDYSKFDWDLSHVDVKAALKNFYRQYNPEKSFIVGEILQKYVNEEVLLLQQLCERYNLTQHDMQVFLDATPSKDSLFEEKFKQKSAVRRPSATIFTNNGSSNRGRSGSFSQKSENDENGSKAGSSVAADRKSPKDKTNNNNSSGNSRSLTRKDSSSSKDFEAEIVSPTRRRSFRGGDSSDNNSVTTANETKEDNNTKKGGDLKFQMYYWDLTDVDIGNALKLLYKELNPTKSPNTSALDHKSPKEILNLLRQLCKRHCLTESEMSFYLKQSKKQNRKNGKGEENDEDEGLLELDSPQPQSRPGQLPSSSGVIPPPPARSSSKNAPVPPPAASSNTKNMMSASTPPPPPPPARPTAVTSVAKAFEQTFNVDDEQEGGEGEEEGYSGTNATDDYSIPSSNRYSVEHLKPTLPNGKKFSMGPIIREIKGGKEGESSVPAPAPAPYPSAAQEHRSLSHGGGKQLLNPSPTMNHSATGAPDRLFSISNEITSTDALYHQQAANKNASSSLSGNNVNSSANNEVNNLRNELERTKQQIDEMTKDNQMVMSLLKQGNFNILNNGSIPNNTSNDLQKVKKETKGIQVEDMVTKTEFAKYKTRINTLEGK
jgi:hypothetical protein